MFKCIDNYFGKKEPEFAPNSAVSFLSGKIKELEEKINSMRTEERLARLEKLFDDLNTAHEEKLFDDLKKAHEVIGIPLSYCKQMDEDLGLTPKVTVEKSKLKP